LRFAKSESTLAAMTQLRCTLFALLGLTLAACSDDETIVSVNYSLGEGVAIKENSDTQVHVLITQGGQKFEETFPTPTLPGTEPELLPDGGDGTGTVAIMVPDSAYFQRYALSSFGGGEATLEAELLRGTTVLFKSKSTFDVREHGAVAAYVDFVVEPPPPAETGSSSDTAAPASSAPASSATDAGSSEGATSAPDAASSSAPDATTAGDSGTVAASSAADAATTGAGSSDVSTDGG
jgi:hypothetical protein